MVISNVPENFCAEPPRIGCAAPTEVALRSKNAATGTPFWIWVIEMDASVALSVVEVWAPFSVAVIGVPEVWPNDRITAALAGTASARVATRAAVASRAFFMGVSPDMRR